MITTIQCERLEEEAGEKILFGVEAGRDIHYVLDARALADKETKIALSLVEFSCLEHKPVTLQLLVDDKTHKIIKASAKRETIFREG
jgi:hypothetical protein